MKKLIPILLLVVSAGLFNMYINPSYTQVKAQLEQKNQYALAIEKAKELQATRDSLITKYNELPKEDLAKLERLLPRNLNAVKLVTDISSIGATYGIAVRGITVKDSNSDNAQDISLGGQQKQFQTSTVTFRFSAKYADMISFVKDLEKSLQLIDIKSILFESKDDTTLLYDYTITINAYWVK